jgi:hypothetical protein
MRRKSRGGGIQLRGLGIGSFDVHKFVYTPLKFMSICNPNVRSYLHTKKETANINGEKKDLKR